MKKILLIDDDKLVRDTFGLALRRNGYHVTEAESAATGLALARQHHPDLILSDIYMPGVDGTALLRDIRKDPELKSRQVVLMTSHGTMINPRKAMDEGADDFLEKPVTLPALLRCMEARFQRLSPHWRFGDEMLVRLQAALKSRLPHEFFTPLAGIIGLVEILRTDAGTLSEDEVQEVYRDIHRSALRLHRALRNYLLALNLETAPPVPLPAGPLPPGEVAAAVRAGVDEALRHHGPREVKIHLAPATLQARADDLVRIVEELVDNACKFSPPGMPVEVNLDPAGRLTVIDRGQGLTQDRITQIAAFEQFDRKQREQQGLGLGLVLVQKLAQQGNASFSLLSPPGQGCTVEVAFPLAPSSVAALPGG
jgi:signal transduction histidine kinase